MSIQKTRDKHANDNDMLHCHDVMHTQLHAPYLPPNLPLICTVAARFSRRNPELQVHIVMISANHLCYRTTPTVISDPKKRKEKPKETKTKQALRVFAWAKWIGLVKVKDTTNRTRTIVRHGG